MMMSLSPLLLFITTQQRRLQIWKHTLLGVGMMKLDSFEDVVFILITLAGMFLAVTICIIGPSASRNTVLSIMEEQQEQTDDITSSNNNDKIWVEENLTFVIVLYFFFLRLGLIPTLKRIIMQQQQQQQQQAGTTDNNNVSSSSAVVKKQTAAITHGMRGFMELMSTIVFFPLIIQIFLVGSFDLSNPYNQEGLFITAIVLAMVYIVEMGYRHQIPSVTIIHHSTVLLMCSFFLDRDSSFFFSSSSSTSGEVVVPPNLSYIFFAFISGYFVALEYPEHIAMSMYHIPNGCHHQRKQRYLAWAILSEIVCKIASTILTIGYLIMHSDLMPKSIQLFLTVVCILVFPAQYYGPYVLLIVLEKLEQQQRQQRQRGSSSSSNFVIVEQPQQQHQQQQQGTAIDTVVAKEEEEEVLQDGSTTNTIRSRFVSTDTIDSLSSSLNDDDDDDVVEVGI